MKFRNKIAALLLLVVFCGVMVGAAWQDFRRNIAQLKCNTLTVDSTSTFTVAPTFAAGVTANGDITLENDEIITNGTDAVVGVTYNDDAIELGDFQIYSSNTAGEDANYFRTSWWFEDEGSDKSEFAFINVYMDDESTGTADGSIQIGVVTNDVMASELILTGATLTPAADGGLGLGTTALAFGPIVSDGAADFNSTMNVQGAVTLQAGLIRTSQEYCYNAGGKPGSANGWLTTGGLVNLFNYTLPASEATTATLVFPISGLHVGDTITGIKVVGQAESAGNIAELDVTLRKITTAAAANVDALVGTIPHIHIVADTALANSVGSLTEVVAADETFYFLLSGTTAANTDFDIQGVTVTVTTN